MVSVGKQKVVKYAILVAVTVLGVVLLAFVKHSTTPAPTAVAPGFEPLVATPAPPAPPARKFRARRSRERPWVAVPARECAPGNMLDKAADSRFLCESVPAMCDANLLKDDCVWHMSARFKTPIADAAGDFGREVFRLRQQLLQPEQRGRRPQCTVAQLKNRTFLGRLRWRLTKTSLARRFSPLRLRHRPMPEIPLAEHVELMHPECSMSFARSLLSEPRKLLAFVHALFSFSVLPAVSSIEGEADFLEQYWKPTAAQLSLNNESFITNTSRLPAIVLRGDSTHRTLFSYFLHIFRRSAAPLDRQIQTSMRFVVTSAYDVLQFPLAGGHKAYRHVRVGDAKVPPSSDMLANGEVLFGPLPNASNSFVRKGSSSNASNASGTAAAAAAPIVALLEVHFLANFKEELILPPRALLRRAVMLNIGGGAHVCSGGVKSLLWGERVAEWDAQVLVPEFFVGGAGGSAAGSSPPCHKTLAVRSIVLPFAARYDNISTGLIGTALEFLTPPERTEISACLTYSQARNNALRGRMMRNDFRHRKAVLLEFDWFRPALDDVAAQLVQQRGAELSALVQWYDEGTFKGGGRGGNNSTAMSDNNNNISRGAEVRYERLLALAWEIAQRTVGRSDHAHFACILKPRFPRSVQYIGRDSTHVGSARVNATSFVQSDMLTHLMLAVPPRCGNFAGAAQLQLMFNAMAELGEC